jgi:hypothetical protein
MSFLVKINSQRNQLLLKPLQVWSLLDLIVIKRNLKIIVLLYGLEWVPLKFIKTQAQLNSMMMNKMMVLSIWDVCSPSKAVDVSMDLTLQIVFSKVQDL